jgi:capsid assembly protease
MSFMKNNRCIPSVIAEVKKPWYATKEVYSTVCEIIDRESLGNSLSPEQIKSLIGDGTNKSSKLEIIGNTAIIECMGIMIPRYANIFDEVSGLNSMELVGNQIKTAVANFDIDNIIVNFDSGGGTSAGCQKLWDIITEAKQTKPVYALVDTAFSAAYYVASACTEIYCSNKGAWVGSIGVIMQLVDASEMQSKLGIKVTDYYKGEYKSAFSSNKPRSEKDEQFIDNYLQLTYDAFIDAVAYGRSKEPEFVDKNWADAQFFTASQAVDNGMVDSIISLEDLLAKLKTERMAKMNEPIQASALSPEAKTDNLQAQMVEMQAALEASQKQNLELLRQQKLTMELASNLETAQKLKESGKLSPFMFNEIFGTGLAGYTAFSENLSTNPVTALLDFIDKSGLVQSQFGKASDNNDSPQSTLDFDVNEFLETRLQTTRK